MKYSLTITDMNDEEVTNILNFIGGGKPQEDVPKVSKASEAPKVQEEATEAAEEATEEPEESQEGDLQDLMAQIVALSTQMVSSGDRETVVEALAEVKAKKISSIKSVSKARKLLEILETANG